MRGGGGEGLPPQKNVNLRGAVVDLPERQEGRQGKHKSTLRGARMSRTTPASTKAQKSQCFFLLVKASPAKGRRRLQKNTPGTTNNNQEQQQQQQQQATDNLAQELKTPIGQMPNAVTNTNWPNSDFFGQMRSPPQQLRRRQSWTVALLCWLASFSSWTLELSGLAFCHSVSLLRIPSHRVIFSIMVSLELQFRTKTNGRERNLKFRSPRIHPRLSSRV